MSEQHIVYWRNGHVCKWQVCTTFDKAMKFKARLRKQLIYYVWIGKCID